MRRYLDRPVEEGGGGGLSLKEKVIGWHIKQRIDLVGLRKGSKTADSRHMTRKLRKKTRILMSRPAGNSMPTKLAR